MNRNEKKDISKEEKIQIIEFLNKHHKPGKGKWFIDNSDNVKYDPVPRSAPKVIPADLEQKIQQIQNDPNLPEFKKNLVLRFYKGDLSTTDTESVRKELITQFSDEFKNALKQIGLEDDYIEKFKTIFLKTLENNIDKNLGPLNQFMFPTPISDPAILKILSIVASDQERKLDIKNAPETKKQVGEIAFQKGSQPLKELVTEYLTDTKDIKDLIDQLAAELDQKGPTKKT